MVSQIKELHENGVNYRHMAVLYRAHYVTRPVEEALLKEKIPYHIYSGVPFFGRAEIKDALSYLRMTISQDDLSFRGTKAQQFVDLIESFSTGHEDERISDLFSAILDESGYETMLRTEGSQERLDNLAELKQSILEYETTCGEEATAAGLCGYDPCGKRLVSLRRRRAQF